MTPLPLHCRHEVRVWAKNGWWHVEIRYAPKRYAMGRGRTEKAALAEAEAAIGGAL